MNRFTLLLFIMAIGASISIAQTKGHPRLFFQEDEVASLRDARLSTHKEEWASLLKESERLVKHVDFSNPQTKHLHGEAEKLAGVALVNSLDPSLKYKKYIKKSILQFCGWKEWQMWIDKRAKAPANDLAIGQYLVAICAAYDIQHDLFSDKQQRYIDHQLIEIADRFCEEYSRFHTERFDIMNCNHGTNAYAGLNAVRNTVDHLSIEMAQKWDRILDHKYNRLVSVMNDQMSDGASDEGATYYMFQLKTYLQWFEIIRNAKYHNDHQPYSDLAWFRNTSTYGIYSILPGGEDNFGGLARYADCNPNFWGDPKCTYPLLAKRLNDPIAKWMANEVDVNHSETWRDESGKNVSNGKKYDFWRYIWKDTKTSPVELKTLKQWHMFEDLGIFAWRSSWDNDASYFTSKSGQHYQGHAQPDDGQFMLHKAGVPYIVDLGYSNPKSTNEHNVLMIDGKGQIGDGENWPNFGSFPHNQSNWGSTPYLMATDSRMEGAANFFQVVMNPTGMYANPKLKQWHREFVYVGDFYILRDHVALNEEGEMSFLLHSYVSQPGTDDTYDYTSNRSKNPFHRVEKHQWTLVPMTSSCEAMQLYDLSEEEWNHSLEASWLYDNYERKKDGVGYVQLGYHLSSKRRGKEATSTFVFGFDNEIKGLSFEKIKGGVSIQRDGALVGKVQWESDGEMTGYYQSREATYYFFRDARDYDLGGVLWSASNRLSGVLIQKNGVWNTELHSNTPNHIQTSTRGFADACSATNFVKRPLNNCVNGLGAEPKVETRMVASKHTLIHLPRKGSYSSFVAK
ncbi:heparinase II/III-family protein [Halosquirtibacter xylanolyticus]|uniref:heparinase II/III domain-containing protein n=1 Tax=Halosquirtibacter xylanolyticus TaxID=3374599 RepID=UPI0037486528|nr:heparinase II/III-family protein [Prolixibacteraceae bacterium]